MSRKTNRAAAIAAAAMMIFTLASADGSGAFAQDISPTTFPVPGMCANCFFTDPCRFILAQVTF